MPNVRWKSLCKTAWDFKDSKWFALFLVFAFVGGFIVLSSEVQESLAGEAELIGLIDQVVLSSIVHIRDASFNRAAIDLTAMGSGSVLTILIVFLSAHFIFRRKWLYALQATSAGVGAALLTSGLKFYFERSRPDVSLRLVDVQGLSYPSGHSLASAAVYFTVAILATRSIQSFGSRLIMWSLFLGLIAIIGMTRIYLGVHYFSDVVAGIMIGIAWASLVEFWVTFFEVRRSES